MGLEEKWPILARHERAADWLRVWTDIGRAARTIDAYARGLAEFLEVCERKGVDPVAASRADVAVFVRTLTSRPSRHGVNVVSIDSGFRFGERDVAAAAGGGAVVLRLSDRAGRARVEPGWSGPVYPWSPVRGQQGGLVPRLTKLPWIPNEAEWLALLVAFRGESARNRLMLALAYDAALRREELCALRTDDVDPGRRMLRVRAETTKRPPSVEPESAESGALGDRRRPTG
jgi:integrase/recombinase XerD